MSIAEGLSGIFEDPSLTNRANTWSQPQTIDNHTSLIFSGVNANLYANDFVAQYVNGIPVWQIATGTDGLKNLQNQVAVANTPTALAPTIASGAVYQNTTASYQTLRIEAYAATAGTAGSVAVALGTSGTPSTIETDYVSGGSSSTVTVPIVLRVPPQWYYSLTVSGAVLGSATGIQE
jgi:hypothetical protein